MANRRCALIVIFFCCVALSVAQQQPTTGQHPMEHAVYVDPVCPVSAYPMLKAPNVTKELKIFYYPSAKEAKLKDPQSLALYIGFNMPHMMDNSATIPFIRNDDHWEAVVPMEKGHTGYAIFYVKDEKTQAIDDNGGKLWDVMYCVPVGERDTTSVLRQAESYTGVSWPLNIHRPKDYERAVAILESFIASDSRAPKHSFVLESLWNYEAARDGGDANAWAKVATEIEKYVKTHQDSLGYLYSIGNYIGRTQDKFPPDFVDRTVANIDGLSKNSKHPLRAQVMYSRAVRVPDPQKRLAALDEFIKTYPDVIEAVFAQDSRFYVFVGMKDLPGAEQAFAAAMKARDSHKDELAGTFNDHMLYLSLASLYVEKGVKLKEAIKLADAASETLKPNPKFPDRTVPPSFTRSIESNIAETKARVYLALKQPQMAVVEAQKAVESTKTASYYFVLAQALVANGEKQKALDAYFEALLMPSNSDLKFAAELQQYYVKQGFGDQAQFEGELEKRKAERFKSAKYVPKLVDQTAPALEFTTLKGEKFDATALKNKTVVVNFWSPG